MAEPIELDEAIVWITKREAEGLSQVQLMMQMLQEATEAGYKPRYYNNHGSPLVMFVTQYEHHEDGSVGRAIDEGYAMPIIRGAQDA